jgi:hypothetical protein
LFSGFLHAVPLWAGLEFDVVMVEGIQPLPWMCGVKLLEHARTVFSDIIVWRTTIDRLQPHVPDVHGRHDRWSGIQALSRRVP